MTPDLAVTIQANPDLHTSEAVRNYVGRLVAEHSELAAFKNALIDVVNTTVDDRVEIFSIPDMEGDFASRTNGTRILWMPDIGRAAVNAYQGGDWTWTDAASPEDALTRYRSGEVMP